MMEEKMMEEEKPKITIAMLIDIDNALRPADTDPWLRRIVVGKENPDGSCHHFALGPGTSETLAGWDTPTPWFQASIGQNPLGGLHKIGDRRTFATTDIADEGTRKYWHSLEKNAPEVHGGLLHVTRLSHQAMRGGKEDQRTLLKNNFPIVAHNFLEHLASLGHDVPRAIPMDKSGRPGEFEDGIEVYAEGHDGHDRCRTPDHFWLLLLVPSRNIRILAETVTGYTIQFRHLRDDMPDNHRDDGSIRLTRLSRAQADAIFLAAECAKKRHLEAGDPPKPGEAQLRADPITANNHITEPIGLSFS